MKVTQHITSAITLLASCNALSGHPGSDLSTWSLQDSSMSESVTRCAALYNAANIYMEKHQPDGYNEFYHSVDWWNSAIPAARQFDENYGEPPTDLSLEELIKHNLKVWRTEKADLINHAEVAELQMSCIWLLGLLMDENEFKALQE